MKRGDFILIGTVLALALAAFVWMKAARTPGSRVEVRLDGKVTAVYPLSEERQVVLEGYSGGSNTLEIHGGEAWVSTADCPDALCVHQGRIRYEGQTLVCLPHRLVIEIRQGEAAPVDGVAK